MYSYLLLSSNLKVCIIPTLACKEVLWGTLVGVGGTGKGRRACNYLSKIWIPPPIPPWLPADWAIRFPLITAKWKRARMWANIEKHVPRVMMSLLMSPRANQHCASTFSLQIFKFQRDSCKLALLIFSAPPPERAGEHALQAIPYSCNRTFL